MAQIANTVSTTTANGNREDLVDAIYNTDPFDTPFLTNCPKVPAKNSVHDWQTDSLAAASGDNKQIEGDDANFSTAARPATVRLSNNTQISRKLVSVTGTQEAVLHAGRRSEIAKELLKMGRELRRDIETTLLQNNAKVTAGSSTAGEVAGVPAWMITNTSFGGGSGADPTGDGTDARTDGDQRVFTETLLKGVIASCWDNGGNPNWIMTGSINKQALSEFSGVATKFQDASDKTIVAGADIYISDFGKLVAMPNRFQRARDALILQKDMWAVSFLRNIQMTELDRTGDAEKRMLITEYTMEARNEKSSGIVADLTTS